MNAPRNCQNVNKLVSIQKAAIYVDVNLDIHLFQDFMEHAPVSFRYEMLLYGLMNYNLYSRSTHSFRRLFQSRQ